MSTTRGFYFLKHSGCRHCDFELHFSFIRTSPFSLAAWLTSPSHNGRQNTCFDVVCLPSVLAHRSQRFLHAETRDSSISFFRNSPLRSMIFLAAPGQATLIVPLLTDLDSSTRSSINYAAGNSVVPTIGHDGTLPPRTAAKRSRNPWTTKITLRLAWLT